MKKILLASLMLFAALFAGVNRYNALGGLTEVDDESLIQYTPAALQNYSNEVSARYDNGSGTWSLGGIYKFNDKLGFGTWYETANDGMVFNFNNELNAGTSVSLDWNYHVGLLSWGGKFGNVLLGLGVMNAFPADIDGNGYINNQTYNSNGDELDYEKFTGLMTALNPSAILTLGKMSLWLSMPLRLNMMSFKAQNNGVYTNWIELKPALIHSLNPIAYATMPLNDKVSFGVSGAWYLENDSYKVSIFSNKEDKEVKNLTNANGANNNDRVDVDNSFLVSAGLGITATEKVKIYFDIPFGMDNDHSAYLADSKQEDKEMFDTRTLTRTVTLPVPKLAVELKLGKRTAVQVSAVPTWQRTTVSPEKKKGGSGLSTSDVTKSDSYGLANNYGVTISLGEVILEGGINVNFFSTYIQSPLRPFQEIFNNNFGGSQPLFASFEVKYPF